jgi:hypothetical protein
LPKAHIRSTGEYAALFAQNVVGGAELGTSFDVAVWSGMTGGDLHAYLRCQKKRKKRYGSPDRRGQLKK